MLRWVNDTGASERSPFIGASMRELLHRSLSIGASFQEPLYRSLLHRSPLHRSSLYRSLHKGASYVLFLPWDLQESREALRGPKSSPDSRDPSPQWRLLTGEHTLPSWPFPAGDSPLGAIQPGRKTTTTATATAERQRASKHNEWR